MDYDMTDTKGNSSFKVNHKATEPWVSAIGKLMVNFGAIELATYAWIDRLAKDRLLHDLAIDMPLAKRLEILDELVEPGAVSVLCRLSEAIVEMQEKVSL